MIAPTPADVASNHALFDGGGTKNGAAMRADLGGVIDLGSLEHRKRVHRWLNQRGCRLPYGRDGSETATVTSLEQWWQVHNTGLGPLVGIQLAQLTDDQITLAAAAFAGLSRAPASARRTIGPTAASKVMMCLSPPTFPAWDVTIARAQYQATGEAAYRAHLSLTRTWAIELADGVAGLVDDDAGITVAKLLDEWMYVHHTRALAAARRRSRRATRPPP